MMQSPWYTFALTIIHSGIEDGDIAFFYSDWFETIADCLGYSPSAMRQYALAKIRRGDKHMRIAGVDPGGTTGMVLIELFPRDEPRDFICYEAKQVSDISGLLRTLGEWNPDIIVIEQFNLYPWKAKSLSWSDMTPSQVIGAVKAWCVDKNVQLVEQPAAMRKQGRLYSQQLERSPLFKARPHAKDALRHAIWYVVNHYPKIVLHKFKKEVIDRAEDM